MDLHLKGEMDGIETSIELEGINKNREVPVIICSAVSLEAQRERAEKVKPIKGFLGKPFTETELKISVSKRAS